MNFDDFALRSSKIKNLPLPGRTSHYKMAPLIRIKELEAGQIKKSNPKKAGVLALFYPNRKNGTNLLLILRKSYKGVHSNQIAFPGGKAEKEDFDIMHTALRETHEEVGVPPERISIIRSLSEVYIPPSNFEVKPFMGLYENPRPFVLQKSEVAALVEVPLLDFMDDAKVFTQKLSTSYAKDIDVPAFKLNGYVVWGATAMMLSEIKELLKQVL
ncbi:NUDIX hydrolase [Maribacter arenosus]|uniref:CoA pyrophosphatase n=1 Tax=Maribacter arenosus TaxID=1854708 RepID=A0ABR7VFE7_9FLAO|nr:CoA pyrophosphatase [Maribacter arenosus]MBD0852036.1 CoA pyrophosphatase [Maribacter arenosus]